MRLRDIRALLLATATLAAPTPALAQFGLGTMVYDPAAVGQLITQVNYQLQMLNSLVTQVQQGQAMLNPLGSNVVPGLSSLMQNTQQLMTNLDNIGNTGASLQSALNSQYPTDFSNLQSVSGILSKLSVMQAQTRAAMQQSMELQNQVAGNQGQISGAMASAVTASNGAFGPTSAIQATNQILATLSQQIADLQSILIAHMRAEDAEKMNNQSAQAATSAANTAFEGPDVTAPGIAITNY